MRRVCLQDPKGARQGAAGTMKLEDLKPNSVVRGNLATGGAPACIPALGMGEARA